MSLHSYLTRSAHFHYLAYQKLYEGITQLSDEEYQKDQGLFFKSVHLTLNHLHLVDILWHRRLKQEPPPENIQSLGDELYQDRQIIKEKLLKEAEAFWKTVESFNTDDLTTPVLIKSVTRGEYKTTPELMIATLVNHGTHHRGQLTAILSQKGISYPDLDLPFYPELKEYEI